MRLRGVRPLMTVVSGASASPAAAAFRRRSARCDDGGGGGDAPLVTPRSRRPAETRAAGSVITWP